MQNGTEFRESTKPLLRPAQMSDMDEEIRRLEGLFQQPAFVTKDVNKKDAMRRLKSLKRDFEEQAPQPYTQEQRDLAVKRRDELREKFTAGMPTQAEMRRNPSGAVGKHLSWEKRNKAAILEFKNIELRLHASGDASDTVNEIDIANIERYRPNGGAGELNMHNEQIAGKQFYIPHQVEVKNVMSDEDREISEAETLSTMQRLAATNPAYRKALAILEAAGVKSDVGRPLDLESNSGDP